MKTLILAAAVAAATAIFAPAIGQAQFYYSDGREIALGIDSNRVLVRFDDSGPIPQADVWGNGIGRIDLLLDDDNVMDGF